MRVHIQVLFFLGLLSLPVLSFSQGSDTSLLTVHFKSNQYLLAEDERQKIDSFFREHANAEVESLTGHTDAVGSSAYNQKLSARRSQQVVKYIRQLATAIKINRVQNFGEEKPKAINDYNENRRVEVMIVQPVSEPIAVSEPVADKTDTTIIKKLTFEKIYFIPDKAVVNMESFPYLDELADLVKTYATEKLEIRGHVNCPEWLSSNPAYMQKMDILSEARAKEVYKQLIARGVPADRLTYKGMGNREMVFPEAKSEEEQKKNMRVEIVVRK